MLGCCFRSCNVTIKGPRETVGWKGRCGMYGVGMYGSLGIVRRSFGWILDAAYLPAYLQACTHHFQ